jgi:hypothetical protein
MLCCAGKVQRDSIPEAVVDNEPSRRVKELLRVSSNIQDMYEEIFANDVLIETLKQRCITIYCVESFDFMVAFRKWVVMQTFEDSVTLCDTYLDPSSEARVNIGSCYPRIKALLENYEANRQAIAKEFNDCYVEVALNLKSNAIQGW